MYDIRNEIKDITDEIKDIFKTYIKPVPNPNALSIAMVGLSSLVLVYFVAYKEDPPGEGESRSLESRSLEGDSPSQESRSLEGDSRSLDSRSQESRSLEESQPRGYEQQTTRGGANRHNKNNKKTKRRKL